MTRCARCNDPFELRTATDTRCVRCSLEVQRIVEADELRHTPRRVANWRFLDKDMTRPHGRVA